MKSRRFGASAPFVDLTEDDDVEGPPATATRRKKRETRASSAKKSQALDDGKRDASQKQRVTRSLAKAAAKGRVQQEVVYLSSPDIQLENTTGDKDDTDDDLELVEPPKTSLTAKTNHRGNRGDIDGDGGDGDLSAGQEKSSTVAGEGSKSTVADQGTESAIVVLEPQSTPNLPTMSQESRESASAEKVNVLSDHLEQENRPSTERGLPLGDVATAHTSLPDPRDGTSQLSTLNAGKDESPSKKARLLPSSSSLDQGSLRLSIPMVNQGSQGPDQQGEVDSDDDEFDDLFSYGKKKAPAPRWEVLCKEGSGKGIEGQVSSKEECKITEDNLEDWDADEGEGRIDEDNMGRTEETKSQCHMGRPQGSAQTGRFRAASHLRRGTPSQGSQQTRCIPSKLHEELAAKDAAAQEMLQDVILHHKDLNVVKQALDTSALEKECQAKLPVEESGVTDHKAALKSALSSYHGGPTSPAETSEGHSDVDTEPEEKIRLKVTSATGELWFRLSKNDHFDKLFTAYSQKVGTPKEHFRFRFDGETISPTACPASLDLEDEDSIDVVQVQ